MDDLKVGGDALDALVSNQETDLTPNLLLLLNGGIGTESGEGRVTSGSEDPYQKDFDEIDTDGDGRVSAEEFAESPSVPPSNGSDEGFISQLREELDTNEDGIISEGELSALDTNGDGEISGEELLEALLGEPEGGGGDGPVDSNQDGKIDLNELREFLDANGDGVISEEELMALDTNNDGKISMKELFEALDPDSGSEGRSGGVPGEPEDLNGDGKIDLAELRENLDTNNDGVVSDEELSAIDSNEDGNVTLDELAEATELNGESGLDNLVDFLDKNGDGEVSAEEYEALDTNNDGVVTFSEVEAGAQIADTFAEIDSNGDGEIDEDEFDTAREDGLI